MRKLFSLFLLLTVTLQLHAQTNEASLVSPLINQYKSDETMLNRKYTLKQSEEYFMRMERFYTDWQKQLKALPFNKLTVNERVDYILLKRDIRSDSANLEQQYATFKTSIFTLPFAKALLDFEAKRRIGRQQDGKSTQEQFEQLKEAIRKTTKAVENKNLAVTPVQASWAQQTVNQYLTVFTEAYKFYDGYDPQFTKATKAVYPEVVDVLKDYATVLGKIAKPSNAKDDGSGIVGNPIGRTALLSSLKDEMIAYMPEQIEAIAMKEFAWCDAEMLRASQQMGFGKDWKKALEKVKTDYPELGKQPELVYELAKEAIDFVEKIN